MKGKLFVLFLVLTFQLSKASDTLVKISPSIEKKDGYMLLHLQLSYESVYLCDTCVTLAKLRFRKSGTPAEIPAQIYQTLLRNENIEVLSKEPPAYLSEIINLISSEEDKRKARKIYLESLESPFTHELKLQSSTSNHGNRITYVQNWTITYKIRVFAATRVTTPEYKFSYMDFTYTLLPVEIRLPH